MKTTTNFGFNKPEMTDAADITATNENWDKIDEGLYYTSHAKLLTSADNLNTITESGHYYWNPTVDNPNVPFTDEDFPECFSYMRVWSGEDGMCYQELTAMESNYNYRGCIVRRYIQDDDFISEWEWVNPPMELNRKYRTVERYNNHPVYVQLQEDGSVHKYYYEREGEQDEQEVEITPIIYGTSDLTPGTSRLATGKLYFVYE